MMKNTKKPKANLAKSPTTRTETAKPAPVKAESMKVPFQVPKITSPKASAKDNGEKANHVCLELVKPDAKTVCVAGSFNEWKPEKTPLVSLGNGRWVGDLTVKPGRHEYLFVVDGQWVPDPNARESVANPFGGKNSVLIVSE